VRDKIRQKAEQNECHQEPILAHPSTVNKGRRVKKQIPVSSYAMSITAKTALTLERVVRSLSHRMKRVLMPSISTSPCWVRSSSDNGYYPEFCRRAALSSRVFKNFKRSYAYRKILEHVKEEQGGRYLNVIRRDNPALLDPGIWAEVRENDAIGNPYTFEFPTIGAASPTTLRYLKVCSDLKNLFGNLDGFTVAEAGGGYGGQCLLIDKLWATAEYRIYDLDPVLMLICRYLEHFVLRTRYIPMTLNRSLAVGEPLDLVISNYAFSELPRQLQDRYLERIILKARRGYLTMNSGKDRSVRGEITAGELLDLIRGSVLLPEEPLTGRDNYILAWGIMPRQAR
jgi:hypothetical protein